MHAAAIKLDLRLPGCSSLKEKRRRLRPILDHLRRRMELSASEVDHHDAWQRAGVGVAVVAPQAGRLDEIVEGERGEIGFVQLEAGMCRRGNQVRPLSVGVVIVGEPVDADNFVARVEKDVD